MPELLGLPDLEPKEKEAVRLGTLLAMRAGDGIGAQRTAGCPWILENPPEVLDGPSLFRIPQVACQLSDDTFSARWPQCAMEAEAMKLTDWKSDFKLQDAPHSACQHPRQS